MPQFGETPEEEIRIVKWLKRPGDKVNQGEYLLEVETQKASLGLEAACSGTLKTIVKQEGEIVKPGVLIAWIKE